MGVAVFVGCLGEGIRSRRLAHQLATALPIGPNVVLLIAFVYLVIVPVTENGRYEDGWRAGVFACFITGVFEVIMAFFIPYVKVMVPQSALMASLGGISISFIAGSFAFEIFASPILGISPHPSAFTSSLDLILSLISS